MRDLADAGANALATLRARGVPDLLCHYHFLRAVGEKLFDSPYTMLRKLLREHHIRRELRELLGELRRYARTEGYEGRFGTGTVRDGLPALVLWLLEGRGKKDLNYPFGLPHLGLYQRCQLAQQKAESWLPPLRSLPERRALKALGTVVNRMQRERRFLIAVRRLERNQQAFAELRDVLQLSNAELPSADNGLRHVALPALEARRVLQIEQAVGEYQKALETRAREQPATPPNPSPSATILKYLRRYGAHLFGHPTRRGEDGRIVAVVERTNNVTEHFFARQKQQLRRRLGRAHLGRDLADQPAQAALAANLQHADYVQVLCGSLDHLAEAFAELDASALARTTRLTRTSRNSALQAHIRTLLGQEVVDSVDAPSNTSAPMPRAPATVS